MNIYDEAVESINVLRAVNGLDALEPDLLERHVSGRMVRGGYQYELNGWTMKYIFDSRSLEVVPPVPFDYKTPRCPLTGDLYDENGRVEVCEHEWERVSYHVRQCLRCRRGEEVDG